MVQLAEAVSRVSILIIAAPQGKLVVEPTTYPKTPRDDSIVEDHFGTSISDPYRALEDPDADHTKACMWYMLLRSCNHTRTHNASHTLW